MADQQPRSGQPQQSSKPEQPGPPQVIPTDAAEERSEHDQHVARDRRADQMAGRDGGRWGPTGQSKVGGP